jgi:hypothetical protein
MIKLMKLILVGTLVTAFGFSGISVAAEGDASSEEVTQLELAQILINVMGLSRFLPSPTTVQEIFGLLLENGVNPADGWQENEVVTKAVLARVVVQALGSANDVANPDDPKSWVNWLVENGIPFETIGVATGNVSPSSDPVANFVFDAGLTTDPLKSQAVLGEPDEKQLGADVSGPVSVPVTPRQVAQVISQIPVPQPPTVPVTPDGGA